MQEEDGLCLYFVCIFFNAFFRGTTEFLGCFWLPHAESLTPSDLQDLYGLERQDLLGFGFFLFYTSLE